MKKIIILSYFYPPCNLTAAQRVQSFARYLSEFDVYPIVVTRNWEVQIEDEFDLAKPSGKELIHQKNEGHECYYLPFEGSKRDRLLVKHGGDKNRLLRKLFTFRELLLENLEVFPRGRWKLYNTVAQLIEKEKVDTLLISGNPFWQFYFGHKLKVKFPYLKWIADYRDDWTTGALGKDHSIGRRFIHLLEKKKEKQWLKNCSLITSVTDVLSNRIGAYNNTKSITIANGYMDLREFSLEQQPKKNSFIISYTGYLYKEQQVEVFLNAFKKIALEFGKKLDIKIRFIGTAFDSNSAYRILNLMKGHEEYLMITKRISRIEALEMESKSDVFLLLAYENLKGIPGSKLYQYLPHKKPILLCPTDNDIVATTLENTGLGIICNNEVETYNSLKSLINKKIKGQALINAGEVKNIEMYSRRKQVEKLAKAIKSL